MSRSQKRTHEWNEDRVTGGRREAAEWRLSDEDDWTEEVDEVEDDDGDDDDWDADAQEDDWEDLGRDDGLDLHGDFDSIRLVS